MNFPQNCSGGGSFTASPTVFRTIQRFEYLLHNDFRLASAMQLPSLVQPWVTLHMYLCVAHAHLAYVPLC